MERLELEVSPREGTGKGLARKLRTAGRVPGVVYGAGVQCTSVSVEARTLERLISAGANALIDLKGIRGIKGKLVLVKECQRDPVSRRILHCDFCAVDPKRRVHVSVPVHFIGRAEGVEAGGVLEPLFRELEVSCLPLSIPEAIDVNVESLKMGDSIHIREVDLPEGVELLVDPELPLVNVAIPRLEVVEAVEEEAAEAVEGEAAPEAEGAAEAGKTDAPEAGE